MKLKQIIPTVLLLIFCNKIFFAQETAKAELIAEFPKVCSEELMSVYDGFMSELQNNPTATGYFVFYGNESAEGRNLNYIDFILHNYPRMRRYDRSKISLVRGENQSEMKVQFWIVPNGANLPKPDKEFVRQKITKTTRFDRNWADFHKWFGEKQIYADSFYNLGCEFNPNVTQYANILLAEKNLTGYLVVYGNNKKRAEKVGKFAVNDLVKINKVTRNRLKIIYGGKSEEPQIELWLVPKDDKPPEIKLK